MLLQWTARKKKGRKIKHWINQKKLIPASQEEMYKSKCGNKKVNEAKLIKLTNKIQKRM